jgi:hypothetical protein
MSTITQTLLGLPEPLAKNEISLSTDVVEEKPSAARAMGLAAGEAPPKEEESNIFYINIVPKLNPEAKDLLDARQKDVEDATSFWHLKATEAADTKRDQGKLPSTSDPEYRVKMDNYRIQVTEYCLNHSAWMAVAASQNAAKTWTNKTENLHDEILKQILGGLNIPASAYPEFEKILLSIAAGIRGTDAHKTNQNKWVQLTTYRYDEVQKKVFAAIRTIYFSINEKQSEYVKSKNTTGTKNEFTLQYSQTDFAFNESVWNGSKDVVKKWTTEKNEGFVLTPINLNLD